MKKVYFSTSIHGIRNISDTFPRHLVELMKKKGCKVLTEHVIEKNQEKLFEIFSANSGKQIPRRRGFEQIIRDADLAWSDEADLFIFVLDGASHGVGMELQYALMRKHLSKPAAPILGLIHVNHYEKLSSFVRGVKDDNFRLMVYTTEDVAKKYVDEFITRHE